MPVMMLMTARAEVMGKFTIGGHSRRRRPGWRFYAATGGLLS
jgi:hypothetical protein